MEQLKGGRAGQGAMLHSTGIRIRGYGYGDTGKRHFLKIGLRGYGSICINACKNSIVNYKLNKDNVEQKYEIDVLS